MPNRLRGKTGGRCLGLGFLPDEARHGFVLHIPTSQAESADVVLTEHRDFVFDGETLRVAPAAPGDASVRVIISRRKWDDLAPAFWDEATRRLKRAGLHAVRKPKKGHVPLHPSLGKELCILCWAVEDADPNLIPEAIRNWDGLAPEERWWLYTMTAAATGQALQKGIGWRKALRFALTENPIVKGEGLPPRSRKQLLENDQMSFI